jgi:ATP-dependent Clp protease ATP-binding subunit ClpA
VEPEGLAARALAAAGVTPEQLYGAVGAGPAAPVQATSAAELLELSFDDGTRAALTAALKAALRLRHNYIGTEHLLLGLVAVPGPAADALASLGLTAERAEQLIATEVEAARTRKLGRPLGQ